MRRTLSGLVAAAVVSALPALPAAAQDTTTTSPTSTSAPPTSAAPTSAAPTTTVPPTSAPPVFPGDAIDLQHPGVYVQEVPEAASIISSPTGVTAIVGAGTAAGTPLQLTSVDDFTAAVADPSPALAGAVEQFFAQGGSLAHVALSTDESAEALLEALTDQVGQLVGWDLVVVPAMSQLDQEGWTNVAGAMGRAASNAKGTALLDPPTSVVSSGDADWVATLGQWAAPLRGADAASMAMLSSGLLADGATVSSAAAFAGMSAAVADQEGIWVPAGGPGHPLVDVEPEVTIDNTTAAALHGEGINPIMVVPHYGTAVMGDITLERSSPDDELDRVRTLDMIDRSIAGALQSYVFAPNDGGTWEAVSASISAWLTQLYQEGGLLGDDAAAAFDVQVGLGTSMTAQDVLDGYMVVLVQVSLEEGPAQLSFTQVMATSG